MMSGNGAEKITIVVNDVEHQVEKHDVLIDALHEIGVKTPHFCYHAGLSPSGNCRICYVNLADPRSGECSPRLFTSCTTPLTDGLKVWTDSEAVIEGRKAVMEFLLINHPLDCPVCDKAGECSLQNFTFEHARSKSRMVDHKNQYPVRDLGPTLKIWQTRCIVCTRCVRFLEEVTGTSELTVVNRGDRSEIDTFPGIPVDNPMMGNLTDICPVGAIIDKDFLFQARVWYLEKCDTISPDSALGCNITVEHIGGEAKRIRPRRNDEVNGHWIADEERYNFKWLNDEKRLTEARVDGKPVSIDEAVTAAAKRLRACGRDGELGLVTSAWATLEELDAFGKLARSLDAAPLGFLARPIGEDMALKGWTIHGDKNPNRAGIELLFGGECTEDKIDALVEEINGGGIRGLLVDTGVPVCDAGTIPYELPEKLVKALDKLDCLVVLDVLAGPLCEKAHVVLPSAAYAEKSGTWVNNQGRVQLLNRTFDAPGQATESLELLQRMLAVIEDDVEIRGPAAAFADLAERTEGLGGMTHWKIRRGGQRLTTAVAGD